MSDQIFSKLIKWAVVSPLFVYAGGRLALVIQSAPPEQFLHEDVIFRMTLLILTLLFAGVLGALFIVETIRRVKRRK